jgi:hypothetical protein
MTSTPQTVAIIGDDVLADLGGGAIEMGFYRYLGKNSTSSNLTAALSNGSRKNLL